MSTPNQPTPAGPAGPSPKATDFYVLGGALKSQAACYVVRQADRELLEGLLKREFCYVLTSRQRGKSSIMIRAARELRAAGFRIISLDLTRLGQNLSPPQWYLGLLDLIGESLGIEEELEDFWDAHSDTGPMQRWFNALIEVVLPASPQPVVIFVDEIDSVKSLPFSTDEFFAGIRECYNRRGQNPELERLAFCLLGVASPADLVRDPRTTPFNIGRRIALTDFTLAEAQPLGLALSPDETVRQRLLKRVLYWTNGHPYLTQKLCAATAKRTPTPVHERDVDAACTDLFLVPQSRHQEENLLFVGNQLLRTDVDRAGLMDLYRDIWRGKRVPASSSSPLLELLRLSGVVTNNHGFLEVRNQIYRWVFDLEWAVANTPQAEQLRQRKAYWNGVMRTAFVAGSLVAVLGGLLVYAYFQHEKVKKEEASLKQSLYNATVNVAHEVLLEGDFARAQELLNNKNNAPNDLRKWEWRYLMRSVQPDYLTVKIPAATNVAAVGFSFDGTLAAACDGAGKLRLWSVDTNHPQVEVKPVGVYSFTNCVCLKTLTFQPGNGNWLACGGPASNVIVWDRQHPDKPEILPLTNGVHSLCFFPDGRRLAVLCDDGWLHVWDVPHQTELSLVWQVDPLKENSRDGGLAISSDSHFIAAAGASGNVYVYDYLGKKLVASLTSNPAEVTALSFSPVARVLLVAREDKSLTLYNSNSRNFPVITNFPAHLGGVSDAAFAPDGKVIVTGGKDELLKLWNTTNLAHVFRQATFKGNHDIVTTVAISPAGNLMVSGDREGEVCFWNPAQDPSPSDRVVLPFKGIGTLTVPDPGKPTNTRKIPLIGSSPGVHYLCFLDASHQLNIVPGNSPTNTLSALPVDLPDHFQTNDLKAIALSPDTNCCVFGLGSNTVSVFQLRGDRARWEHLTDLTCSNGLKRIRFSLDGQSLLVLSSHYCQIWWSTNGVFSPRLVVPISYLSGTDKNSLNLAWLAILNTASNTADLYQLTNLPAGEPFCTKLTGHKGSISAVDFSPDQTLIASVGDDANLCLTRLPLAGDGQPLVTVHTGLAASSAVAFSPDGSRIATGNNDGFIHLWDLNLSQVFSEQVQADRDRIDSIWFPDNDTLMERGADEQDSTKLVYRRFLAPPASGEETSRK